MDRQAYLMDMRQNGKLKGKKAAFVFLKNKYRVINNRLLITPTKDSTVRIRRRLKKLNKKLINREIEYNDILQSYQAWTAHLNGTRCYKTIQSIHFVFF